MNNAKKKVMIKWREREKVKNQEQDREMGCAKKKSLKNEKYKNVECHRKDQEKREENFQKVEEKRKKWEILRKGENDGGRWREKKRKN